MGVGSAWCLPHLPWRMVVYGNEQLQETRWSRESQVSIRLWTRGGKYIFHGVEIPYGTEEKMNREKGAGGEGIVQGRGRKKQSGNEHKSHRGVHLR